MVNLPYKRFGRWLHKGGFAILDQALFSGANFAVALVLARWLPAVQYGAFAFAFSIFMLALAFHNALFTEPMLTFGGRKYRKDLDVYLGGLLLINLVVSILIGSALLIAGLFIGKYSSWSLGRTFLALAFAAPSILFLWTLRRVFYIRFEPWLAAIGGMFYFLSQLVFLYLVHKSHLLSATFAFIILGASSSIVAVFYLILASPRFLFTEELNVKRIILDHWRYGRWPMAGAGISWFSTNIYFLILTAKFGLETTGEFKALLTILSPTTQINGVLSMLTVPYLAHLGHESKIKFEAFVKLFLVCFVLMNFAYFMVISFFPQQVLRLFYGGRFMDSYYLLPIFGAAMVLIGFSSVIISAVRSIERPDAAFWAQSVATLLAVTVGAFLASQYGLSGAVFGFLGSTLVSMSILILFYHNFILSPKFLSHTK